LLLQYQVFERYLEPLAQEIGMPGLSAVIVHNNRIAWSRGYGFADVDNRIPATEDTPYPVGGVTQALTGVLVGICVDRNLLQVDDGIRMIVPSFPQPARIREVLHHASEGSYRYDPAAFAALTPVVEKCLDKPFRVATASEILDRIIPNLQRSVPGFDFLQPNATAARALFDAGRVERYQRLTNELAIPYRISRGRHTRSEYPPYGFDAAGGLIATARDLANFEASLDDQQNGDNIPISFSTLDQMWKPLIFRDPVNANIITSVTPTGQGWFVQNASGVRLVWTFGHLPNAASALIVKMPDRRLTMILLSNSDGLAAGFNFDRGDVTTSPFVKVFLRLFI
jgi:CubicO group peptidase (beta-lactamase class C family)